MKLALLGYGRMGRATEAVAVERGHEITLTLDVDSNEGGSGITEEALGGASVAIDFSVPSAVLENVRRASQLGVGMVVGTTGWHDQRAEVEGLVRSAGTGLLHAPNFSIGMALFTKIVRDAVRRLNGVEDYDVHLFEAHHRHKSDHPSGTARRLAELVVDQLGRKTGWSANLEDGAPIDPGILQVAVARAGAIPGVHSIGIEGPDDRIELRHEARSRVGFARGAVMAAEWLEGRSGLFGMSDLMDDLLGGDLP